MVGLQVDFRARLRLNYGGKKEAIIKILKYFFFFPMKATRKRIGTGELLVVTHWDCEADSSGQWYLLYSLRAKKC